MYLTDSQKHAAVKKLSDELFSEKRKAAAAEKVKVAEELYHLLTDGKTTKELVALVPASMRRVGGYFDVRLCGCNFYQLALSEPKVLGVSERLSTEHLSTDLHTMWCDRVKHAINAEEKVKTSEKEFYTTVMKAIKTKKTISAVEKHYPELIPYFGSESKPLCCGEIDLAALIAEVKKED